MQGSNIQAISNMYVVDSKIDLQYNDASKLIGRQRRLNSKRTLAGGAECSERRLNRQPFPAALSLSARE